MGRRRQVKQRKEGDEKIEGLMESILQATQNLRSTTTDSEAQKSKHAIPFAHCQVQHQVGGLPGRHFQWSKSANVTQGTINVSCVM